jgi:hypothetical protein
MVRPAILHLPAVEYMDVLAQGRFDPVAIRQTLV